MGDSGVRELAPQVREPSGTQPGRLIFLDGLRGWASLIVVFYHATWELFKTLVPALHSPVLGLFNDGKMSVYVFFVLSGTVLSYPVLAGGGLQGLRRMALARYVRLTIPIVLSSLLAIVAMKAGILYNREAESIAQTHNWLGSFYQQPASFGSFLRFSFYDVYFRYKTPTSYNVFLWTMPTELFGSFMIFAVLALSLQQQRAMFVMAAGVGAVCLREYPEMTSFLGGLGISVALVNFNALAKSTRLMNLTAWGLMTGAFAISMFYRNHYSARLCPAIATAIVAAVCLSPQFRGFFSNRLSRALGHLSFPLYLTHSLVLCTLSSWAILTLRAAGFSNPATAAVTVPLTLVAAIAVAWIFSPTERLAIALSRRFAVAVAPR